MSTRRELQMVGIDWSNLDLAGKSFLLGNTMLFLSAFGLLPLHKNLARPYPPIAWTSHWHNRRD